MSESRREAEGEGWGEPVRIGGMLSDLHPLLNLFLAGDGEEEEEEDPPPK